MSSKLKHAHGKSVICEPSLPRILQRLKGLQSSSPELHEVIAQDVTSGH